VKTLEIQKTKYKMITPVATEPITLAEVKAQIRKDSGSYADDTATTQALTPASRNAGTYTSTGIDLAGKLAVVNLNSGENTATGTVDAHIEESDDNATFADWTGGTFTQVTTSNDNAVQEIQYTGSKRYIRVVAVVANVACVFGVDVITNTQDTSEDTLLTNFIKTAREYGEDFTGHAFAPQTIDYYLDDFPDDDKIEWPFGPLTSVTSVKYKNYGGTETTMTVTTQYIADTDTFPGSVFLPYGEGWPDFVPYPVNAVVVRGVCGYTGSTQYKLPDQFKQALLMHVGLLDKYRDQGIPDEDMKTINKLYGGRRSTWF
jgi:uncharacterized phiE125 gp8 family phage protein